MTSRRTFILGACGVGVGLALTGCGGSADPASVYPGEYRTVALAAALENQAVVVYRSLLAAGHAGKLAGGPAFASLARTCLAQHSQHAQTWNAVLHSAHKPPVTGVPLAGHPAVQRALSSASTLSRAAALAYRLEDQAAQTFALAAGTITSRAGIAAAAGIAPVEAMHAAILAFLIGEDPAPGSFAGSSRAARTSQLTV